MRKILVVEDEPRTRDFLVEIVQHIFNEEDSNVIVVGNGKEVIERFDEDVDLLIADYLAPAVDVPSLTSFVRNQSEKTKIVMLGYPVFACEPPEKMKFDALIMKPFEVEKLAGTLLSFRGANN